MALKSHTQPNKTLTKPLDTPSGSHPKRPVKLLDVVHRADVSLTCLRKPCHLEFLFSVTIYYLLHLGWKHFQDLHDDVSANE
jgi:hypothetical protein